MPSSRRREREQAVLASDRATVIEATARRSHLAPQRDEAVTLDHVDQRRTQLWLVAFVVLVGLGAMMAVLSVGPDSGSLRDAITSQPAFRFGGLLAIVGFGGYVFEQEAMLRRLGHLLLEERVAADVERNRSAWLTETDRLKSEFVTTIERDLSSALSAISETAELFRALPEPGPSRDAYIRMLMQDVEDARHRLDDAVACHDRAIVTLARTSQTYASAR